MFQNPSHVNDYIAKRAPPNRQQRDDRQMPDKLMADAVLRGKLGCDRANQVIRAMDDLKARGF